MRLEGVSYDVGRVLGMNWRPMFDPDAAQQTYGDFAVPFNGRSRG
jgi:hypothetical protein